MDFGYLIKISSVRIRDEATFGGWVTVFLTGLWALVSSKNG